MNGDNTARFLGIGTAVLLGGVLLLNALAF